MKIILRTFAFIRENIGSSRMEISIKDNFTIVDTINLIIELYPQLNDIIKVKGNIDNSLVIAINGEKINAEEYNKIILKDQDELIIIPPTGGGI